jgi:hypothetical protein
LKAPVLIVPALDAGIFFGNAAMAVSSTAMMRKRSSEDYKNLIGREWRSPPSSAPEQMTGKVDLCAP